MSLQLVEKGLERLEGEIREVRRTQLLMVKMWVRLLFQDNIPVELVPLIADLDKKVKNCEKDSPFPCEKA